MCILSVIIARSVVIIVVVRNILVVTLLQEHSGVFLAHFP